LTGALALGLASAKAEGRAAAPKLNPENGVYTLTLDKALEGGKPLTLHLDRRDGAFGLAFATAPTFNRMPHDVDASGLKLVGTTLKGEIEVTINPDPYVPRDHKPVSCAYTIDAAIQYGTLTGAFRGRYGPRAVSGAVVGDLRPRPELPRSVNLWLKMEQGVTGSNPWHNRTYISVTLENGRAGRGRFFNNKGAWRGTLDGAELKIDANTLAGTITATVLSGRVRRGTYTFALRGELIGNHVTGKFEAKLGGKIVRTGRFVGGVKAAE